MIQFHSYTWYYSDVKKMDHIPKHPSCWYLQHDCFQTQPIAIQSILDLYISCLNILTVRCYTGMNNCDFTKWLAHQPNDGGNWGNCPPVLPHPRSPARSFMSNQWTKKWWFRLLRVTLLRQIMFRLPDCNFQQPTCPLILIPFLRKELVW